MRGLRHPKSKKTSMARGLISLGNTRTVEHNIRPVCRVVYSHRESQTIRSHDRITVVSHSEIPSNRVC